MSNDISTVQARGNIIAAAAAGFLADHVQFVKTIDKANESDWEGKNGFKAGATVDINVPAQYTLGTGADITSSIQDTQETSVPLTVDNQYNIPVAFTSAEIATDFGLKSWAKRVLEPQMITLANNIDKECIEQATNSIYNTVGTPGSTVYNTNVIMQAGQKLDENGCADYDNRYVLLNPAANTSFVDNHKGLFNPSPELSKMFKNGAIAQGLGFNFLRNNLLKTHTNGADVAVAVENSVVTIATGMSTLGVDGVTSLATIKKGSVFTIADVFAVHPVTKATLPHLQQFVVTADVTEASGNSVTMAISPTIYSSASGAKQNVSALPVDEATVTFIGSASTGYAQSLAFHKDAFRFVSLPLFNPEGVHMVGQKTKDGITARIVQFYDGKTDKLIMRVDVLWGMANVRPQWAARIWS